MDHLDLQFQNDADRIFDGLQCTACGRNFRQSNAYSTHVLSCRPQKRRMASALESAKETYKRKKARINSAPVHFNLQEAEHSIEVSFVVQLSSRFETFLIPFYF